MRSCRFYPIISLLKLLQRFPTVFRIRYKLLSRLFIIGALTTSPFSFSLLLQFPRFPAATYSLPNVRLFHTLGFCSCKHTFSKHTFSKHTCSYFGYLANSSSSAPASLHPQSLFSPLQMTFLPAPRPMSSLFVPIKALIKLPIEIILKSTRLVWEPLPLGQGLG